MEALILYFVLFFPSVFATSDSAGIVSFSALREISRILTYTLPSLALLWYIISYKGSLSCAREQLKTGTKDLKALGIGFGALVLTGLLISLLLSSKYFGLPMPPKLEGPLSISGWLVVVFSCLGTGYLEETYFRYYLLTKLEKTVPHLPMRIVFATLLFSICHIYEGPWGFANAVIAGVILSVIFIRFRSLHGIALAHGAYNIFVYAMAALSA
jgi:membrane protease YdiL (CAAX protease family)